MKFTHTAKEKISKRKLINERENAINKKEKKI